MSGENRTDSEEDSDDDSESGSIRGRNGLSFTAVFNSLISGGLLAFFTTAWIKSIGVINTVNDDCAPFKYLNHVSEPACTIVY